MENFSDGQQNTQSVIKGSTVNMKWSHLQMTAFSVFVTVTGGAFLIGYMKKLGFNEIHLGILGGITGAFGFFNIFGSWIVERSGKLKKIFVTYSAVCILFSYAGIFLGYITFPGLSNFLIILILFFIFLWQLTYATAIPALFPWLHGLTGNKEWGKFFNTRLIFGEISGLAAGFAAGKFLGETPPMNRFIVVFSVASVLGLLGSFFISKLPPVEIAVNKAGLWDYIKILKKVLQNKEFRIILVILFLRAFGYGMIGPFQPVFLLEELKLDYFTIAILSNVSLFFSIIGYKLWGHLQSKKGFLMTLKWSMLVTSVIPLVWIFNTQQNHFLIYFAFILTSFGGSQGLGGSGVFSSNVGLTLEYADKQEHKSLYLPLNFCFMGVATSISSVIGGLLVKNLSSFRMNILSFHLNGIRLVFLIANAFILMSVIYFLKVKWEPDFLR